MRKIAVLVVLSVVLLNSGCASLLVANSSQSKVKARAIRAQALPDGGVGIGVDLLSWDVLTEQPLMQLGAAVLDAGTLYYGYQAVKGMQEQTNHKDKDTDIAVTGNGNNVTVVNGDSNAQNGSQDNSSSETP